MAEILTCHELDIDHCIGCHEDEEEGVPDMCWHSINGVDLNVCCTASELLDAISSLQNFLMSFAYKGEQCKLA